MRHPLPAGTRVHHRAQVWTVWWGERERQANPQWGWGTIQGVHSGPYSDGSYEYNVRYDAPHSEGGPTETQWASYHIDEVG